MAFSLIRVQHNSTKTPSFPADDQVGNDAWSLWHTMSQRSLTMTDWILHTWWLTKAYHELRSGLLVKINSWRSYIWTTLHSCQASASNLSMSSVKHQTKRCWEAFCLNRVRVTFRSQRQLWTLLNRGCFAVESDTNVETIGQHNTFYTARLGGTRGGLWPLLLNAL